MALSQDKIAALYAAKRTRGFYREVLETQLAGEENGFAAKETYPKLNGKETSTIYQGFRNAAEKMGISEQLDILNSDEEVYVIFKDRVELVSENGKK